MLNFCRFTKDVYAQANGSTSSNSNNGFNSSNQATPQYGQPQTAPPVAPPPPPFNAGKKNHVVHKKNMLYAIHETFI